MICNKRLSIPTSRLLITAVYLLVTFGLSAQDYREEMKLIRPKPGHIFLMGKISNSASQKIPAEVSLFDPEKLQIEETILADDFGYYLFTAKIGKTLALIIQSDGYFPFYSEVRIPDEVEGEVVSHDIVLGDHLRNRHQLFYHPLDTVLGEHSASALAEIVKLLISQRDLQLWINPQGDSLDPIRVNNLSGYLNSNEIGPSRVYTGPRPDNSREMIEIILKTGVDSAFIPIIRIANELNNESWTIQFMASKTQVKESAFKGLDPVFVFSGSDGYYRYTYGDFASKSAATSALSRVRSKGFRQSFVKKVDELRKL